MERKIKSKPQSHAAKNLREPAEVAMPKLLFRETEHKLLENLLGVSSRKETTKQIQFPLFITGVRGCGKSFLLKTILDGATKPVAFLDCSLAVTEAQIVESICDDLHLKVADKGDKKAKTRRCCQDLQDLKRILEEAANNHTIDSDVTIVLDEIDNVSQLPQLLSGFMHLQKSTSGIKLQLVFVSRRPWQSVAFGCVELGDVVEIHLANYDKKMLIEFIVQMFDVSSFGADWVALIKSFAQLTVDSFYPVTRSVNELQAYAERHFRSFIEPIIQKKMTAVQTDKLVRNIFPVLTAELQQNSNASELKEWKTPSSCHTLPLYVRFLLVAGYLCSYNPSNKDARMVSKRHETVRKPANPTTARKKVKDRRLTVLGPQAFSFDRLTNNFLSLTADHQVSLCTLQIQANIRTLCDAQVFLRVGPEENLDQPKYKCLCSKSVAQQVAASLDLDLHRFLIDFV